MKTRPHLMQRFSLKERVVLLTGPAGLYGRGLCRDLAEAGATVVAAARNLENLEQLKGELAQDGFSITVFSYDQGVESSILDLKNSILGQFGRLDGLVNNSVWRPGYGAGTSFEGWQKSMTINASGLALMHEIFGEVMKSQNQGSIVNIGSLQGTVGPTLRLYRETGQKMPPADYWFHKGGMVNMTRYYAGLFGPFGVRVNCLNPGGFLAGQAEDFVKAYCAETFLGRMSNDTDLGGPLAFLLSDAAAYVTGANLAVDAGYTAH